MVKIPTEAYRQNDFRAGRTVVPPMAKAMMSVAEVTVMAPPAEAIVRANLRNRQIIHQFKWYKYNKYHMMATKAFLLKRSDVHT